MRMLRYLDLFAGAGGLSEGFIRAGFSPVAHIEMDKAACYTLKTRLVYNWLKKHKLENKYYNYLEGKISREELYNMVPKRIIESVLNYEISWENIEDIFKSIDHKLNGKKIDLIVGGPPCQAYSLVGRARDKEHMKGDSRNYLYILYAEFLKKYKPKYFVFENVLGLLSAKDKDGQLYFDKMRLLFKECGYTTEYNVLNAADYGVLQNRKRIILIGKYNGHNGFYPEVKKEKVKYKVEEIFADLPKLQSNEGKKGVIETKNYQGKYLYKSKIKKCNLERTTFHFARYLNNQDKEIYKIAIKLWDTKKRRLKYTDLPKTLQSQKNKNSFLDRFKVVASDLESSQTVVAHISKDGHYFIHPDIQQIRSLTVREVARLQTFPDDYYFESETGRPSMTSAYKQIGNAVPVLLAEKIARGILKIW